MPRKTLLEKTSDVLSLVEQEKEEILNYPGSDNDVYHDDSFSPLNSTANELLDVGDVEEIPPNEEDDFTVVIESYWSEMMKEMSEMPVLKLYLSGLFKMAQEYKRISDTIDDLKDQIKDLGVDIKLTNERARLRDNITSLTTEGWKLLDALLNNLNRIQGVLSKNKPKEGPGDMFEDMFNETKKT